MCVRKISDISLRFVLCQNKGEVAFDLFDHSIYLSGAFKCSAYLREAVKFYKRNRYKNEINNFRSCARHVFREK